MSEANSSSLRDSGVFLDAAPDPIVVVDPEGCVIFFNRQAEEVFGWSAEAISGKNIDALIPHRLKSVHGSHMSHFAAAPKVRTMGTSESEVTAIDASGREFPVEISLSPISMDGELMVMAAIRDITDRREHERQLVESESFFRTLGDVRAAILSEKGSSRVLDLLTSRAVELWPGSTAFVATVDGHNALRIRSTSGPEPIAEAGAVIKTAGTAIGAALRTRSTIGEDGTADTGRTVIAPFQGVHRSEGVFAVRLPRELNNPKTTMVEALANEAAMSVEVESAALERRKLLVTTDRERIARDLHDIVIQRLFAAGMRLQSAIGSPELLESRSIELIKELDETITEIRNTIFRLTEPDTSVREQLRALVDGFSPRAGTTISLTSTGDLDQIPDEVAAHLVPTLNEAVSNALRHANASTISIALVAEEDLTLTVTDNGGGLQRITGSGRGLTNMAERAAALDGSLAFNRPEGGGTELIWIVPLSPE